MKTKTEIQDEIVVNLPPNSHGILLLAPRVGKSRVTIQTIKKEKPKSILWVTPSIKLRDVDIPSEFKTWKAKTFLKKTKIICWSSLSKVKGKYDKIILDEYQYITEENVKSLLNGNIKYKSILALSGTHPKGEGKNEILKALKLEILEEIGIEEAVEQKLIADYTINILKVKVDSLRKDVRGGSKEKPFATTERKQYDYLTSVIANTSAKWAVMKRMRLIQNSISKEIAAKELISRLKGRKLIFAGSIAQAEKLSPYTYHSKTNSVNLDKFMEKENDTLCCVKAGGVGFTFKEVETCVIVQVDSDSTGATSQKLLRALLAQGDYKANIWIVCLMDTVDQNWLASTLLNFDSAKIKQYDYV